MHWIGIEEQYTVKESKLIVYYLSRWLVGRYFCLSSLQISFGRSKSISVIDIEIGQHCNIDDACFVTITIAGESFERYDRKALSKSSKNLT